MKVLALNASPRTDGVSKTRLMLDALTEGMRDAGADVDVVNLREKKISTCRGCMCCWTRTPGVCALKDDMTQDLYPRWLESDLAVYAFPLYHFTLSADMKAFVERTLPAIQPFFIAIGNETIHPLRGRHPRIVFLSVAGFPEHSVFDQLSSWARFIYGRFGGLAAEIYRPLSEGLTLPALKRASGEVLEATRLAGREIVQNGTVSQDTLSRVTRDLTDNPRLFLKAGDIMWRSCIREGLTLSEFSAKGMVPRPETIGEFVTLMQVGFVPEAAPGLKTVLQFEFTGGCAGSCHFIVDNGSIRASEGQHSSPDLSIEADFGLWMDIVCGKADPQQLFLDHAYTVRGDPELLVRMNSLFGR